MKFVFTVVLVLGFGGGLVGAWLLDTIGNIFDLESCTDAYISPNFTKLEKDFKERLYGQHFVESSFLTLLKSHYAGNPQKPLVVSLQGWPGSGKNYVVSMVANAVYKRGLKSRFVHTINGLLQFPYKSQSMIEKYTVELQTQVTNSLAGCPLSMFIFDEIDKTPPDIIEGIKPYFDYHTNTRVEYRRAVFFFLSNVGGDAIFQKYQNLWRNGVPRLGMQYGEFEKVLRHFLYSEDGAFKDSIILKGHLMSMYLPFLPLERRHVKMCAEDELRRQGKLVTPERVSRILDELEYADDVYSISGCKGIADIVNMLQDDSHHSEL